MPRYYRLGSCIHLTRNAGYTLKTVQGYSCGLPELGGKARRCSGEGAGSLRGRRGDVSRGRLVVLRGRLGTLSPSLGKRLGSLSWHWKMNAICHSSSCSMPNQDYPGLLARDVSSPNRSLSVGQHLPHAKSVSFAIRCLGPFPFASKCIQVTQSSGHPTFFQNQSHRHPRIRE